MINQKKCDFEQTIVEAVKSGFPTEAAKRHADACADCRETWKIASWLNNISTESAAPKHLPAAGFIWWKSRVLEKRRAAEMVAQPIKIAQTIAACIVIATFFWLLASGGAPQSDSFLAAAFNRVFASMEIVAFPLAAGIICFTLACVALTAALRRFMPEK